MRLSQKVFWIFFSITLVTLVLALNQFVTFYAQQRYSQAIKQISKLQSEVRQLDQLHLALFQPDKTFDSEKFERLLAQSSDTSEGLRTGLAQMPLPLLEKLDSMDFNLNNFSRSLAELATTRRACLKQEARIHEVLSSLHLHESVPALHLDQHQRGKAHAHKDLADVRAVTDLQLHYQVSSFVHHRQYQRLPEIKDTVARLQVGAQNSVLAKELDFLILLLEKHYRSGLELDDRKHFVEDSASNFIEVTQQMLADLENINTHRQRLISRVSLGISFVGVLAAIFYWCRIRIYIRRFLFNQNQVMQAIQTDTDGLQLVPQSKDELGNLTNTLKDLSVELKSKKADLLASEQKYRSLVESLNEWIWETNVNHRFSYCSEAGEKITGHSQSILLGRKYLTLSKGHETTEVFEHIEQHFRERTPFTNIERKILCADGSTKHLIASGMPLFDGADRFVGFRGVDRDITALVQAREAHEQLEMKLLHAQKMESIGRLAGGVAHDFNNILSAIIGYTELILHRLDKDNVCYKYVGEIRNSGERAAGLTKQLLAFSRKQARKPQNLDLAVELKELEDMLQRLVGEQINIQIEIEDNLWPVLMDKSQLEQVIVNLTVNAKDAMPNGGLITISLRNCNADCKCHANARPDLPAGDYVQLVVTDTGCGISGDVLPNIFDPFFTTKDRDKGTGLGLAMVYGIITQNQGDILVSSELGKGSCFTTLLPRSTRGSEEPQAHKGESVLRKGGETILFVEDEAALLRMHSEFLDSLGYRVVTAADGEEAFQKFQQVGQVDLLITDVVMPKMGGIELAVKLHALDPDLKVLYTSGYTDHDQFAEGVLQEGINFIYKPASPIDVLNLLEKLLD